MRLEQNTDLEEQKLRQHVEFLAQKPRFPGTAHHRDARRYIAEELTKTGMQVREHAFSHSRTCSTGVNIIAGPIPDDPARPLVIVGAHYDTVRESPGADDNASGVATMLRIADAIASDPPKKPRTAVLFTAFDLEESPEDDRLIGRGSHAFLQEILRRRRRVFGMFSLEMLGDFRDEPGSQNVPWILRPFNFLWKRRGNFLLCASNMPPSRPLDALEFHRALGSGLRGNGVPVRFFPVISSGKWLSPQRLRDSDHQEFWDRGIPAAMLTDTANERNWRYHTPEDTPDTLNYRSLGKCTLAIGRTVRRLFQSAVEVPSRNRDARKSISSLFELRTAS